SDQVSRQCTKTVDAPIRRPVLNDNVLALDVAQLAETLPESIWVVSGRGGEGKPTDPEDFVRRLRLSGKRCCQEAESEDNKDSEGAVSHGAVLQNVPQDHRPEGCPAPV